MRKSWIVTLSIVFSAALCWSPINASTPPTKSLVRELGPAPKFPFTVVPPQGQNEFCNPDYESAPGEEMVPLKCDPLPEWRVCGNRWMVNEDYRCQEVL